MPSGVQISEGTRADSACELLPQNSILSFSDTFPTNMDVLIRVCLFAFAAAEIQAKKKHAADRPP